MTSRVIDGHRKQEVAASSSWNSLLIKSERGKAASCLSNSSFVNMAKSGATIGQSASFREVSRPNDGLVTVGGGNEPSYVPSMTDNLERRAELFSMDRFGGEKSDFNLSARDHHPSQNNQLQMQHLEHDFTPLSGKQ